MVDIVKVGRKSTVTKDVVAKLVEMFSIGASDQDACNYAGITIHSLYRYCKANPKFAIRKEALKRSPFLNSIKLIDQAIKEGDINTAKWYAERKGKDEFSLRTELDVNDEPERKFTSIKLIEGKKIIKLK